jgi:hypothetical protein
MISSFLRDPFRISQELEARKFQGGKADLADQTGCSGARKNVNEREIEGKRAEDNK